MTKVKMTLAKGRVLGAIGRVEMGVKSDGFFRGGVGWVWLGYFQVGLMESLMILDGYLKITNWILRWIF